MSGVLAMFRIMFFTGSSADPTSQIGQDSIIQGNVMLGTVTFCCVWVVLLVSFIRLSLSKVDMDQDPIRAINYWCVLLVPQQPFVPRGSSCLFSAVDGTVC